MKCEEERGKWRVESGEREVRGVECEVQVSHNALLKEIP